MTAAAGERERASGSATRRIVGLAMPDSVPAVDFELSPEQREIQSLAREFASAEIEPNAAEWDRDHGFPRELLAGSPSSG